MELRWFDMLIAATAQLNASLRIDLLGGLLAVGLWLVPIIGKLVTARLG